MLFKTPEQLVEFFNTLDLSRSTLVFKEDKVNPLSMTETNGPIAVKFTQDLGMDMPTKKEPCGCEPAADGACTCVVTPIIPEQSIDVTPDGIIIESMAEEPSFHVHLTEGNDNTFYVKDYETVENACGTGKVELENRTSYMNMCEMEGVCTVKLNVVVGGKQFKEVPFILERTSNESYLSIGQTILSELS